MGLPPAQGHNNLRLTNTANLYQNHNFRLDKTQFNTTKTHHKYHMPIPYPTTSCPYPTVNRTYRHHPIPHTIHSKPNRFVSTPYPIQLHSRSLLSSKRLSSIPRPTSILKPSRSKHIGNRVQFEPNSFSQRQTPYSYYERRNTIPSFDNYRKNSLKKVRLQIPPLSVLPTKNKRTSSRHRIPKHSIVSNMPLINVNSSVVMVNHSPFGLQDPRFGIFHHCSQSVSYF